MNKNYILLDLSEEHNETFFYQFSSFSSRSLALHKIYKILVTNYTFILSKERMGMPSKILGGSVTHIMPTPKF